MQMRSAWKKICMGNQAFGDKPHASEKLPEEELHGKEAV